MGARNQSVVGDVGVGISTVPRRDVGASIARLFVYPVKSCAGIELAHANLTETGLELDRAWMVVDGSGNFVSQREQPRMALVAPQLQRSELVLNAPGMPALRLALDGAQQACRVRVWDDALAAFDLGQRAAQWFTEFLSLSEQGLPMAQAPKFRLVRFDPGQKRRSNMKWTGGVAALNQFSDGFPLLVLGQASLDEFNVRLQASGHAAVGVERFRPNIVLSGLQAHDEDRLGEMHIGADSGQVVLKPVKPCQRCPIPNIDPATAQRSPAVGDTLQQYRQDARLNGAVTFGMNAIVLQGVGAVLRVGQLVAADYVFG